MAIINVSNMVVVLEKPYRRARLDAIVSGCDVDIVSGITSLVRLKGVARPCKKSSELVVWITPVVHK